MVLNAVHDCQGIGHDRDIPPLQSLCHFQTPTHFKRFCQTGRHIYMLFLCSLKEDVAFSSFDDATPCCLTIGKQHASTKAKQTSSAPSTMATSVELSKSQFFLSMCATDFLHQTGHVSRNLQQLEVFLLEHQLVSTLPNFLESFTH